MTRQSHKSYPEVACLLPRNQCQGQAVQSSVSLSPSLFLLPLMHPFAAGSVSRNATSVPNQREKRDPPPSCATMCVSVLIICASLFNQTPNYTCA